jgi:hypothetical protein
MAEQEMNKGRRRAVRMVLGGLAAVPLVNLVGSAVAQASDLPHLAEDDPAAKGLQYHEDAAQAPRADKADVKAADQFCHSCSFIQADSGEWRPCQLFPGKAVSADGWCTAWAPKA